MIMLCWLIMCHSRIQYYQLEIIVMFVRVFVSGVNGLCDRREGNQDADSSKNPAVLCVM